jgi:hypothetical protein
MTLFAMQPQLQKGKSPDGARRDSATQLACPGREFSICAGRRLRTVGIGRKRCYHYHRRSRIRDRTDRRCVTSVSPSLRSACSLRCSSRSLRSKRSSRRYLAPKGFRTGFGFASITRPPSLSERCSHFWSAPTACASRFLHRYFSCSALSFRRLPAIRVPKRRCRPGSSFQERFRQCVSAPACIRPFDAHERISMLVSCCHLLGS